MGEKDTQLILGCLQNALSNGNYSMQFISTFAIHAIDSAKNKLYKIFRKPGAGHLRTVGSKEMIGRCSGLESKRYDM